MAARAFIVCNSIFLKDPARLAELKGPQADAVNLWAALADDRYGIFDRSNVTPVFERDSTTIKNLAEIFFKRAAPDDTLLFYYSGHGIRTPQELFLCASDTDTGLLLSTAVGSGVLKRMIDTCSATRIIFVLDCCYAGSFKGDEVPARELQGEGVVVLAAAGPADKALDAEDSTTPSPFTAALCSALMQGAEDQDGDGFVELDEVIGSLRLNLKRIGLSIYPLVEGGIGQARIARRPGKDGGVGSFTMRSDPDTPSRVHPDLVASTLHKLSRLPHPKDARELASKDPDLVLAVMNEMAIPSIARMAGDLPKGLLAWVFSRMEARRLSFVIEEIAKVSGRSLGNSKPTVFEFLIDMDEDEAKSFISRLEPKTAALVLGAVPTSLATSLVSALRISVGLSILQIMSGESLTNILVDVSPELRAQVLRSFAAKNNLKSITFNFPPPLLADFLKQNFEESEIISQIASLHAWRAREILDLFETPIFAGVAALLSDDEVADLLEHRSPQARDFFVSHTSSERAARLIVKMDPQQANWLLDGIPEADILRVFGLLSPADRVVFYLVDPTKFIGVIVELGDASDVGWVQDNETMHRFTERLLTLDLERVNSTLRAAGWDRAASVLTCMDPGIAAQVCTKWSDFSGVNSLGYSFYRMRPIDAARILENAPLDWVEECLLHLGDPHSLRILERLNQNTTCRLIETMQPGDVAGLVKNAAPRQVKALLSGVDPVFRREVQSAMKAMDDEDD